MYSKRKITASIEVYPSGRVYSFTDRLSSKRLRRDCGFYIENVRRIQASNLSFFAQRVISSITKTVMRSDKFKYRSKASGTFNYELRLREALKDDPNSDKLLSLKRKWKNDEYMYNWDTYVDEKENQKVDKKVKKIKRQAHSDFHDHLDNRLKANISKKSPTGGNQTNNILVPQLMEFTDILHKTGKDQTQVQVNNDDAGNERNDEIENIADNILSSFIFEIEANIQKTTEEKWNVSKMKELIDKYYKIIIDHFDELLDVDHKKLIMEFSKPPYDDFSYKCDDEFVWYQRIFINLTRQFLRNRGALFDKEASELRYYLKIVNPLLAGAFEMIESMSLSLWNQRVHLDNEISQLSTLAILVYGKIFSFLSMHYINNEFVVKNYDDFILPTINECLVRLPKIIETIAKFKIRIIIYHREYMANFYKVVHSLSDNLPNASSQKKRNNYGHL
ncbi:9705_t:CDS:10 [Funneliformis mosseae]|uniref:9705_t:CDS:1 n=1 Tax=Funneliformis mosseae TaxID=27381 RepID=A0A9N9DT77_FUNMO|nr:9705_t:CDS:10 [Funneliformis mosseae]